MTSHAFVLDPSELRETQVSSIERPSRSRARRNIPIHLSEPGCGRCRLRRTCRKPMMGPCGEGELGLFILGMAPGPDEDKVGKPFVGRSGRLLRSVLHKHGIDLDRDCVRSNVIQCYPANNEFPSIQEVEYCRPRWVADIAAAKPKVILALGAEACWYSLEPPIGDIGIMRMRGRAIPSREFNCWVVPSLHPAAILRTLSTSSGVLSHGEEGLIHAFEQDVKLALAYLDGEHPLPANMIEVGTDRWLSTPDEVDKVLCVLEGPVAFDYETTGLDPWAKDARVLCVGVSDSHWRGWCFPVTFKGRLGNSDQERIRGVWRKFLGSPVPKIAHNAKFEIEWSVVHFGVEPVNVISDTMVDAHILDEREGTTSLEYQVYFALGETYKDIDRADVEAHRWEDVARYCSRDARMAWFLRFNQLSQLAPGLKRASELFMASTYTNARMEARGVRIDLNILGELERTTAADIATAKVEWGENSLSQLFLRKFGHSFDFRKNVHIAFVLHDLLGVPVTHRTDKTGDKAVHEAALRDAAQFNEDAAKFVGLVHQYRHAHKLQSTYLSNLRECVSDDGLIHPSINLHTARSYRSSCSRPNLQNQPKRDPLMAVVRKVFVPTCGECLAQADYSAAEYRMAACYIRDERMTREIMEGYDPHRAWAARIFGVPEDQVTDKQRYVGKNGFVFPVIYGAGKTTIARHTGLSEEDAEELRREFFDTYPGVRCYHQAVQESIGNRGYVEMLSGFRARAPLGYTDAANYPVQGASFHNLLYALNAIWDDLEKRDMRSRPILQVHDDILFDAWWDELPDLVEIATTRMTTRWFDGMVVLPAVEWAVGPENWGELESL